MRRWLTTGLLGGALVANYVGHRTGWWLTLCTNTRQHLSADQFDTGWDVLSAWMKTHYRNGFIH